MKDFKFIAKDVECNGIGGHGYGSAIKHRGLIQNIVDEVVNTIGRERLYELAIASGDDHRDYYAGHRFNSNEDLMYRLVSGLANYVYPKFDNEELAEMYLGAQLNMLSYEDKQTLVVDAARDCASADHWYTFEKQWD